MPAMAKEKRLAAGAKGEGGLNSATMPAIPANCRPSRRRTLRHNISASTSAAGALDSAWRALSSGRMPRAAGVHQRAREDERRRLFEPALHLFERTPGLPVTSSSGPQGGPEQVIKRANESVLSRSRPCSLQLTPTDKKQEIGRARTIS